MEQFHGVPVWHVSGTVKPVRLIENWRRMQRQMVERMLIKLLGEVGRSKEAFMEEGTMALHLRVPATPEEEETVGGTRDDRCEHGMGLWVP